MKKYFFIFLLFFVSSLSAKEILLYEKKDLPLTHIKLVIKGGTLLENKAGETYLLAKILSQSNLASILENVGSFVEINPEYDYFEIGFTVLSDYHIEIIKQTIDFLNRFQFSQEEFEFAQKQAIEQVLQKEDNFYDKVRLVFGKELYGEHRYGKPITGTVESLKEIKKQDIENLYQRMLNKKWIDLIVVGKIHKNKAIYQKIFQLPEKKQEMPKEEVIKPLTEPKTTIIEADSSQVFVRIGGLGISRKDKDYLDYLLISDIIGGGFGSVIVQKLREEKGLTYSPVGNFYSLRKEKGYFFIAYSTRPENLEKSIALVHSIFQEIKEKGIDAQNLLQSIRYIYGTLFFRLETNESIADLLTEQTVFELEPFFWRSYQENLFQRMQKQVDTQKINAILRDFFEKTALVTIILKPREKK